MKKIFFLSLCLTLALLFLKANVVKADENKVEIWSYSLDERIEHRSIKVGGSNDTFGIMYYPSDLKVDSVKWKSDDTSIARIEGDNETATVYGIKEGCTTVRLTVKTTSGETLEHSSMISVYTPAKDADGYVSSKATFYRGADSSSWIRSEDVKKGQNVEVLGVCGKYCYLSLPDDYTFDDDRSARTTYALKSKIYIPVKKVVLDKTQMDLGLNKTVGLKATVLPSIATDKSLTWKTSRNGIVNVSGNGVVKAVGIGTTNVIVKSTNNKSASCSTTVLQGKGASELGDFKLYKVSTTWGSNTVRYERCHGANFYALYVGIKRKDGTYDWENIYESYGRIDNGDIVDDDFADNGKTYYYKKKKKNYILDKNDDFVEVQKKTSNIVKIKTAKPNLKAVLSGKKNVKLTWNKFSKEGAKKQGYIIYRKTKGKKYTTVKTIDNKKTTSFTDKKTTYKTKYEFAVRAFYKNKKGKTIFTPYSNDCEIKTKKK